MNAPFANPNNNQQRRFAFPKSCRILRSAEFRQVYDQGFRHQTPFFVAFCLKDPLPLDRDSPRIGFTTPRALGKSTIRNRVRRRIREAIRVRMARLAPEWRLVFNPRRAALQAPFATLEREVDRLLDRLATSSQGSSPRSSADTSSS